MKHGAESGKSDLEDDEIIPSGPLWKYLSLSENQSPKWQEKLAQICIEGKIYCSGPREFNDPFDCLPEVVSPQSQEDIDAGTDRLISRFVDSVPELSREEIEREARLGILSLSPGELKKWSETACENTAGRMGVFCLSARIDSVLMWSHYAMNHTGIALRFEPMINLRGGLMPLLKVRYQDTRPQISYFEIEGTTEFTDALTTKAKFWDYECEWRKIVPDGAGKFVQFDRSIVTGLVFGANCSAASRRAVKDILAPRQMEYWQIVTSGTDFAIRLEKAA